MANTDVTGPVYEAAAAGTYQFPVRYGYMTVTNPNAGTVVYATGDGTTASTTNGVAIPAGGSAVVANGLPIWYQSSNVLVHGSDNANGQSKAGQLANPGTIISVSAAASIAAAG